MSTRVTIVSSSSRRRREVAVGTKEGSSVPRLIIKPSSVYGCADKRPLVMGGTAIERSMLAMGSIAIYNVKPVVTKSANEKKNYTLYAVHVQNAITGRSWVVHRRYSDFLLLRQMIVEHFEQFQAVFPRLEEMVSELYFPRKHKIRSNTGRVVEHRCTAFLEFLVMLHRIIISQGYVEQKHISDTGMSILRGFLGSALVKDPAHRSTYAFPNPIPQSKLTPSDRAVVNQCGTLKTVIEDDKEYEDCDEDENVETKPATICEDPVPDSSEEASMMSDTDSHSTLSDFDEFEDAREYESPKNANRKLKLFAPLMKSTVKA